MGRIKDTYRVKRFCGFIYSDDNHFQQAFEMVSENFGFADIETGPFDFNFTEYYKKEMGGGLKRRLISFKGLVSPSCCSEWKVMTNKIEEKFLRPGSENRAVNIDPGYLDLAKVVLLSTKDYSHRIYLEKGIFAELTLFFSKNSYRFLPWTYPDYMTSGYLDFFLSARNEYRKERLKL